MKRLESQPYFGSPGTTGENEAEKDRRRGKGEDEQKGERGRKGERKGRRERERKEEKRDLSTS